MTLPTIHIKFIPQKEQRFSTPADWQIVDNLLTVWISEMADPRYECIVLMHELTEIIICWFDGVSSTDADAFDALWEKEIEAGLHNKIEEAGFDKRCCYRRGHVWGARMERLFCFILGVKWRDYEDYFNNYNYDQ